MSEDQPLARERLTRDPCPVTRDRFPVSAGKQSLTGIGDALTDNVAGDDGREPLRDIGREAELLTAGDEDGPDDRGPEFTRFEFLHVYFFYLFVKPQPHQGPGLGRFWTSRENASQASRARTRCRSRSVLAAMSWKSRDVHGGGDARCAVKGAKVKGGKVGICGGGSFS